MSKSTAIVKIGVKEFTLIRNSDGSIHIIPVDSTISVKSQLRIIADTFNIVYDSAWNTRYLGYRVIKALNGEHFKDSLIEKETMLASDFLEEEDSIYGPRVKICPLNVAKVEAMISYDSKYARSGDESAHPDSNWIDDVMSTFNPTKEHSGYRGSSAFWMKRIYDHYYNKEGESFEKFKCISKDKEYFRFIIYNAVCAVDAENSTHINADGAGRIELTEKLVLKEKELMALLKDNQNYPLIALLSQKISKGMQCKRKNEKITKIFHRNNFSFATKFCHYACFHIFENIESEYRDSYPIYDYVVSTALLKHYPDKVKANDFSIIKGKDERSFVKKYRLYVNVIDDIRKDSVSRNGFDHLMWYYYKGRGKDPEIASK